jgi:hypothetical protein
MGFGAWFIIVVLATVAFVALNRGSEEVDYVRSPVDGREYLVQEREDKQAAADVLARVVADLTAIVRHMGAKYPDDPEVKLLVSRFDPDAISEGSPTSGYTSYTVDKGAKVVVCVRQADAAGTLVDRNVIMYVAIHELAHIMTASVGHKDAFWTNNRRLLKEAMALGLYTKTDFSSAPAPYCGIDIKTSLV